VTEVMIAVDGGEVWADDSGGDGPPLVLLHSGVGDSRIWEPVLPAADQEHEHGRQRRQDTRVPFALDLIFRLLRGHEPFQR
jgi:pimeloyl-ACP methyl ester carboxylesterase